MVNLQREYSSARAKAEKEIRAEVRLTQTSESVEKLKNDLALLTVCLHLFLL